MKNMFTYLNTSSLSQKENKKKEIINNRDCKKHKKKEPDIIF